ESMDKESARDIFLSYLSVYNDENLSNYFSKCQLEYKEKDDIGVYTCTVSIEGKNDYIFVISNSKKLKSEVNPTKKNIKELVYLAHFNYDKSSNKIAGEKLLYSINGNLIIDNQEIKQHL
ncbi:MAG: hypothetical protein J6S61_01915, partial [Elusimicrobiaceae bacterium]|nr:hypothetical protein [Elusimicrobiaceae bacterium]